MVTATVGEENGEFCIAVASATRTAGILTQLVKGDGCQIEPAIRTILIRLTLSGSKGQKGDELVGNEPQCLCEILFS